MVLCNAPLRSFVVLCGPLCSFVGPLQYLVIPEKLRYDNTDIHMLLTVLIHLSEVDGFGHLDALGPCSHDSAL